MYTLYWAAGSGALAPQVMLEEMGLAYRTVVMDMEAGAHRAPEYLAINPAGQVPALALPGGQIIGESAAMVLLLGERHPGTGLVPAAGEPDRPVFLHWLLFMATSVYMTMVRFNHPERYTLDASGIDAVREAAMRDLERFFGIAGNAVAGDWFLARGYSALDIYLHMLASWHPERDGLLGRQEGVARVCRSTARRPACARIIDFPVPDQ